MFTAPQGVTQVTVEAWGGGGAGGGNNTNADGGGAYSRSVLIVTSGQSYTVTVGDGGTGTAGGNGGSGGDTWFNYRRDRHRRPDRPAFGRYGCLGFEYNHDQRYADGLGNVQLQYPVDRRLRQRECHGYDHGDAG